MPANPTVIPVTAEHIRTGVRHDPAECALAQSLKAHFGPELEAVAVTGERIILDLAGRLDRTYWQNSPEVQDWILRYDLHKTPPAKAHGFSLSVEFDPIQGETAFHRE